MKIKIKSNFVLEGLEQTDSLEFPESAISLRDFFEELSRAIAYRFEFIEKDSLQINQEDWAVEVNGLPYQVFDQGLGHTLKDGDRVDIRILPMGGGK
ncbi:MAG: hypothetical protein Q8P24_16930 [Desulfobacterales bacterium]|nr:hypothetical protein [Desulfobacterales bacterium]